MSKGKALVDVLRHTKFKLRINSFVIVKMIGFLSDVTIWHGLLALEPAISD